MTADAPPVFVPAVMTVIASMLGALVGGAVAAYTLNGEHHDMIIRGG